MGPVAVHLKLSGKLCGHHPVFHVSLLHKYLPGGDGVNLEALLIIEDVDEYEVEALIAYG